MSAVLPVVPVRPGQGTACDAPVVALAAGGLVGAGAAEVCEGRGDSGGIVGSGAKVDAFDAFAAPPAAVGRTVVPPAPGYEAVDVAPAEGRPPPAARAAAALRSAAILASRA